MFTEHQQPEPPRRPLPHSIPTAIVGEIDEAFDAMYATAEAAATALDEERTFDPTLLALGLRTDVRRLHRVLVKASLSQLTFGNPA